MKRSWQFTALSTAVLASGCTSLSIKSGPVLYFDSPQLIAYFGDADKSAAELWADSFIGSLPKDGVGIHAWRPHWVRPGNEILPIEIGDKVEKSDEPNYAQYWFFFQRNGKWTTANDIALCPPGKAKSVDACVILRNLTYAARDGSGGTKVARGIDLVNRRGTLMFVQTKENYQATADKLEKIQQTREEEARRTRIKEQERQAKDQERYRAEVENRSKLMQAFFASAKKGVVFSCTGTASDSTLKCNVPGGAGEQFLTMEGLLSSGWVIANQVSSPFTNIYGETRYEYRYMFQKQ
jgi:hypothetical protein